MGILLPEKTAKLNSGTVVAVGPGSRDRSGNLIPVSVNEGDTVLLPEYGGTQIDLGDNKQGFPVWLKYIPGISLRTDNEPFKDAMNVFTKKIVDMMKEEKLFESQGGPIILA